MSFIALPRAAIADTAHAGKPPTYCHALTSPQN